MKRFSHLFFILPLYFLFFAFIGGQVTRIDLPSNMSLTLLDIAVSIFVLIHIIRWVVIQKKRNYPKEITYILAFVGIACFSLVINDRLFAQTHLSAVLYFLRWIVYAAVFFVVWNFSLEEKKQIRKLMYISGAVLLLIGFAQYFYYPNLRNLYYLGWDEHLYRLFSTFLDPNFASIFFILYFIFVAGYFLSYKTKHPKHITMLVLTMLAIILTFSRGGILTFLAVSTGGLILLKKLRYLVLIVLFASIALVGLSTVYQSEGTNLFRTASTYSRIESIEKALVIIQKNPVFGVGFNAYDTALVDYGLVTAKSDYPNHALRGTDNSFLFVWATTGIVGLISYLFMLVVFMRKSFVDFVESRNRMQALIVFLSLTALLLNSFFVNSLFYPPLLLWMWMLLGLRD